MSFHHFPVGKPSNTWTESHDSMYVHFTPLILDGMFILPRFFIYFLKNTIFGGDRRCGLQRVYTFIPHVLRNKNDTFLFYRKLQRSLFKACFLHFFSNTTQKSNFRKKIELKISFALRHRVACSSGIISSLVL